MNVLDRILQAFFKKILNPILWVFSTKDNFQVAFVALFVGFFLTVLLSIIALAAFSPVAFAIALVSCVTVFRIAKTLIPAFAIMQHQVLVLKVDIHPLNAAQWDSYCKTRVAVFLIGCIWIPVALVGSILFLLALGYLFTAASYYFGTEFRQPRRPAKKGKLDG